MYHITPGRKTCCSKILALICVVELRGEAPPPPPPTLARHVTKDRDAVLEMKRAHEADMLRASGATRSNHGVPVSTWAAEVGTAPPHMAVMYGAAAHEARLRLCF
mgnify:CR=1 FL=1